MSATYVPRALAGEGTYVALGSPALGLPTYWLTLPMGWEKGRKKSPCVIAIDTL